MTESTCRIRATTRARRIATLIVAAAVTVSSAACASDGPDGPDSATPGGAASTTDATDPTPPTDPDDTTDADDTNATTDTADPAATATADPATSRCAPADASSTSGEPVTLAIWHGLDGDVVGFFDEVIAEFESEHPDIDVVSTRFEGSYTDGIEQLAALAPADRPDVFMGSNSSIRLQVDSQLFVPPAECTGGDTPDALRDLLATIEHTYTVDGTLVAAPYNISTPVMMYDRKLWRAAGLDPDDPPATFDELESAVRQLRDSGAADTGMVLYDRAASWLVEQAAAQEGRLLVEPANGREGTAIADLAFDTPEAAATLERFRVLRREGYILWAGINQSGRDDLLQLANTEVPTGLTLHTSASIGDVLRFIESGVIGDGVEAGVAPLPGNAPGGLVGGGAWWLLDHDDPARVGAAWTLVDWLIQPGRVAELAAFTGYVPTTDRAAASPVTTASWAERPVLRVGFDQLAAMPATDAAAGMQVGPMVEVQRALEVAAALTIDADQDPAEQLRAAEGTARSALDAYDAAYGTAD
jgi:sn-glycerol 3-phosphate transport system substrate-binding protein